MGGGGACNDGHRRVIVPLCFSRLFLFLAVFLDLFFASLSLRRKISHDLLAVLSSLTPPCFLRTERPHLLEYSLTSSQQLVTARTEVETEQRVLRS